MKKSFNQLHYIINNTQNFSKRILAKLYLYKYIIRATKKDFILLENQRSINKIFKRLIPTSYLNLIQNNKNILSYSITVKDYIFKHKYNNIFQFEIPYINNIVGQTNGFSAIFYKLLTVTVKKQKHFMLFIRIIKGGFLAYSGGLFGFLPKSQSIKLYQSESKKFDLKKNKKFIFKKFKKIVKRKINLNESRYIINWYKIKMKLFQLKNKLKVKNFKRKRKLKRSRAFLEKIRIIFLYNNKKFNYKRLSAYSDTFRLKLQKILKLKKSIWSKSKLNDIKNLIMNAHVFKQKKRACKLLTKHHYGKRVKKKTQIIKFKQIRTQNRQKQLLRFLL